MNSENNSDNKPENKLGDNLENRINNNISGTDNKTEYNISENKQDSFKKEFKKYTAYGALSGLMGAGSVYMMIEEPKHLLIYGIMALYTLAGAAMCFYVARNASIAARGIKE